MAPAIIAGLGNPGVSYNDTRHNVGFFIIDHFAEKLGAIWQNDTRHKGIFAKAVFQDRPIILVKPQTFMNLSGTCLAPISAFYKVAPEAMLVIHDDINLPPATEKLTIGGGDGGHNGIADILRHLPNTFARLRIGIGPKQFPEQNLADYVLGKMTPPEKLLFTEKQNLHTQHIETWLANGTAIAQNFINRKPSL